MGSSNYSLEFVTVVAVSVFFITHANSVKETGKKEKKCDLYDGRWVLDESYPLYSSKQCPLILEQFNCMGNGRPDQDYQKYRWQPNNCNLPRWDQIQDGNVIRKDMDRLAAYEKALTTLTKWIDQNVDAKKIKIFFQGVSPDHWNSSDWGTPLTQRCAGQPEPLVKPVEATGKNQANVVLEEVLRKMRKPIHLLDINEMSQFRVDGHPSMYGNRRKIGMDCTHWCLPGVPDVWNELLYATFLGL
ncbi:hypothetical protein RD792_007149 [Penstemon davidsonii]|uniref:Trichome birefringence-like C-terminal domain-containing protein n=1 Tax=Penstemon davidsonii TaxID=160366 RepID=A0ABR0D5R2_9LAMI|nr:hypothetical protein RD792_007149 [Penstemon davidsonii]